jgi:hypothetical protein
MRTDVDLSFDVYVRSSGAVVTIISDVSWRAAHVVARHHADDRRQPVYIRSRSTKAVETVGPSALMAAPR